MQSRFTRRWAIALLAPALAAVACERSLTDVEVHEEFHTVEVRDLAQAGEPVVATWITGQGWTGTLPAISLAAEPARIQLGVRVYDDDGDLLPLDGAPYSIRYELATGAAAGVIATEAQRDDLFQLDRVNIYGGEEGSTRIQFLLWDVDHPDDATDPIDVVVNP